MNEIWRAASGFEGTYEVSSHGAVRRIAPGKSTYVGRISALRMNKEGYVVVNLSKPGKHQHKLVARLVAQAFLGNPPAGQPEVNHRDGNKANNVVENLEWMSRSQNQSHAYRTGLRTEPRGQKHPNAKLTDDSVVAIRLLAKTISLGRIAEFMRVSRPTITAVIRRETWKHI